MFAIFEVCSPIRPIRVCSHWFCLLGLCIVCFKKQLYQSVSALVEHIITVIIVCNQNGIPFVVLLFSYKHAYELF